MDGVDKVLKAFERSKHRAYGIYLESKDRLDRLTGDASGRSNDSIERAALDITIAVAEDAVDSTMTLAGLVSSLDETQLKNLVRASDTTYEAYLAGDYRLFDSLALRTQIYRFIIRPSPDVMQAHREHCEFMARLAVA